VLGGQTAGYAMRTIVAGCSHELLDLVTTNTVRGMLD
jgi:hypothetical protein